MELKPAPELTHIFQPINKEYPNLKEISSDPPLYIIDNFLDPLKCENLISMTEEHMVRAPVVGKGHGEVSESRTSSTCYILREDVPSITQAVSELLMNKSIAHLELPQIGRYNNTETYAAHFDAFDLSTSDGRRFAQNGGQRVATVLIYLNDVNEGGRTYFPQLQLEFKPKKGSALVFAPASLDGTIDPRVLHAALPAVDQKWVCQVWVRQSEYNGVPSITLPTRV